VRHLFCFLGWFFLSQHAEAGDLPIPPPLNNHCPSSPFWDWLLPVLLVLSGQTSTSLSKLAETFPNSLPTLKILDLPPSPPLFPTSADWFCGPSPMILNPFLSHFIARCPASVATVKLQVKLFFSSFLSLAPAGGAKRPSTPV